jgi:hypothetical protein
MWLSVRGRSGCATSVGPPRIRRDPAPDCLGQRVLLQVLYRLLARIDESESEAAVLADVAVGLMYDAIEPVGRMLGTMPVGSEHPGATAGAPFELFSQPDDLLPHHRAAWVLFAERLDEAAASATRLSGAVEPLSAIAATLNGHAVRLRSAATPQG